VGTAGNAVQEKQEGRQMSLIDFTGQVAIVTGAGRGLGREYAREIARRGGKVVVSDIGGVAEGNAGSWASQVVAEIEAAGGEATPSNETVATSAGGSAIVEMALERFGRVDVIVHNAGFLRPAYVSDMTDAEFRDVIDVHLVGAFNVVRPAWKHMQQQGYGRIVLTSSSSVFGYPASCNYVAAKAGILGLTTALASEGQACGILVNAILPYAVSDIVVDNPPCGETPASTIGALEKIRDRRHTRSVSPLLLYLASLRCMASGQAFSALSGRFARVAPFISEGWIADAHTVTAEDVAENFDKIAELTRGYYPQSMFEEIERVGADLEAAGLV